MTPPQENYSDTQFWVDQFTQMGEYAYELVSTADEVMAAMAGDLGEIRDREKAAVEVLRRVDAYKAARRAFIEYGQAMREAMEAVA